MYFFVFGDLLFARRSKVWFFQNIRYHCLVCISIGMSLHTSVPCDLVVSGTASSSSRIFIVQSIESCVHFLNGITMLCKSRNTFKLRLFNLLLL